MTWPARAVWERGIYLYNKVWLVIYAIFVAPERCNDKNKGENDSRSLAGRSNT
jgi:hypothetical protein